MNQQLHRLALELLVVSFLNLLFLHGFSLFTLSFRVRKIRGGSVSLMIVTPYRLHQGRLETNKRHRTHIERLSLSVDRTRQSTGLEPTDPALRCPRLGSDLPARSYVSYQGNR